MLTPAIIADLRASLRPTSDGGALVVPHIVWGAADNLFYLHAGGRTWAAHRSAEVLGALLIAERAERGFIATVLSPTHTVDEALLDPAGRKRALASRVMSERNAREAAALADERRRNSMRYVDPASVTIEDIL